MSGAELCAAREETAAAKSALMIQEKDLKQEKDMIQRRVDAILADTARAKPQQPEHAQLFLNTRAKRILRLHASNSTGVMRQHFKTAHPPGREREPMGNAISSPEGATADESWLYCAAVCRKASIKATANIATAPKKTMRRYLVGMPSAYLKPCNL